MLTFILPNIPEKVNIHTSFFKSLSQVCSTSLSPSFFWNYGLRSSSSLTYIRDDAGARTQRPCIRNMHLRKRLTFGVHAVFGI